MKRKTLTKSRLAILLSKLGVFETPKVRFEQYPTDSEVAADLLWTAFLFGDLGESECIDLGCGTGILGIGALLLGAKKVTFVDIDKEALTIAKVNVIKAKSETSFFGKPSFKCLDVREFKECGNIVFQNPPFGVKVRHQDLVFLQKATSLAPVIYSLHLSESEEFIQKYSRDHGLIITFQKRYAFPLKSSMFFHRRKILRINVTLFRFQRNRLCRK